MPVARSLRDRRQSAMKAFLLGASLCLLLPVVTSAQQNKSASDDLSAVRATVRDYIEAYYTGDCRRMEQTLHPHYLKHVIHGNIPMREKTGLQMVQRSEEHTSELQSLTNLVCRLLLEKKKKQ